MKLNPDVIDIQRFLKTQWQQTPCLLRQGLADFDDAIEPEILAGLAMEEGVDSRLVLSPNHPLTNNNWAVEHGPFEDYERLGEADWTLLVQSVNEWVPAVGELLRPFRFLPQWRVDDVMISFSCEGGGVGPHLDQYDVFIIQGSGRRRWRVGARQPMTNYQPCEDLTLVKEAFEPVIDEVLEAGDILYIPAGCPHDGIALEPSLNYSVGFRAPSQAEWLMQLGEQAMQFDKLQRRYTDPELSADDSDYVVDDAQLEQTRQLLIDALQNEDSSELLLRVMSQSKRGLLEPELPYTAEQMPAALQQTNAFISRVPGARWLYSAQQQAFFSNGERFPVTADNKALCFALADIHTDIDASELIAAIDTQAAQTLLAEVLNQGIFALLLEETE